MGKLTGGIDYDMIGRTGNHVGRRVKGQNIIAMRQAKSNKPPSPRQFDQRNIIKLGVPWLRRLSSLINVGFAGYTARMSAMNAAVSHNLLQKAFTGTSPNYKINYAKIAFSKGSLHFPDDSSLSATAIAKVDFNWKPTVGVINGSETDKASFVVYSVTKDRLVILRDVATRSALTYSLQLPIEFSGDTVHCWMSFTSANGKQVSDSYHIGQVGIV